MRRENICVINRDLIKIEHRASDKYVYEWLEDYLKGKSTFLNLFLQTATDANTFFSSQSTYLLLCRLPTSTLASQYSCDHVHDFAEI